MYFGTDALITAGWRGWRRQARIGHGPSAPGSQLSDQILFDSAAASFRVYRMDQEFAAIPRKPLQQRLIYLLSAMAEGIRRIMEFRPCIDIHNGKVKQIVGSSLKDAGDLTT